MGNRVYLCCTDFQDFPAESQFDDFFKASGTEYEANSAIPLFWLCLFSSADIRIHPANHDRSGTNDKHNKQDKHDEYEDAESEDDEPDDDESDEDSRPYAYLFCSRTAAIERLKRRTRMLEKALGAGRYALYGEWTARLEAEEFQHILVRTEALDGMGMEGELEEQLREAFKDIEDDRQREGIHITAAIGNIAGLQEDANLSRCEAYVLVGSASGPQRWPPALAAEPKAPPSGSVSPPRKKSKWLFWK